jgi:hypothetical protein
MAESDYEDHSIRPARCIVVVLSAAEWHRRRATTPIQEEDVQ